MGCDIHAFVEVKRYPYQDTNRENGVWISTDKWSVNEEYVLHPDEYPEDSSNRFHVDYDDYIYRGRNYYLFAILADVRNYREFTPISRPKGLPDDVCSEIKQVSDHWDCDGHSHSYLTLKELLEYDWQQEIEAVAFSGSREKAISEYGDNIVAIVPNMIGVDVHYQTTIAETVSEFMETIEKLKTFLKNSDYPSWQVREEDIRLVFWFDN